MKFSVIILLICLFVSSDVYAQVNLNRCETNRTAPAAGPYFWEPDSEVKVFFQRGMFTPEQQEALKAAMNFWSHAGARIGSGVTFKFAGETDGTTKCESCLIVSRQNMRNRQPEYLAYFFPFNRTPEGQLVKAWIILDDRTTRPDVLQTFMAHELGHSVGLGDCPKCKEKSTLMGRFPSVNEMGLVLAPSACDVEVVRDVYQQKRLIAGK